MFVTDKIKDKESKVIWCPTEKAIGDFYTKLLQGSLFVEHRDEIIGIKQEDIPLYLREYEMFMRIADLD